MFAQCYNPDCKKRFREDRGIVYSDEFIAAAAVLNEQDAQSYNSLHRNLKEHSVRVSDWECRVREVTHKRKAEAQAEAKIAAATTASATRAQRMSGRPVELHDPSPWPHPVDGSDLLGELVETIQQYVIITKEQGVAIAVRIVWSHPFDAFAIAARISIESPVLECGKTTLLDVIERLVRRPLGTPGISPAAIYRTIEQKQPTLLLDELDADFSGKTSDKELAAEKLRILNSGHTRAKANVIRLAKVGDDFEPRQFSTYAPIVTAMIGHPPATLCSRAIPILMKAEARW